MNDEKDLIKEAVKALGINVPVMGWAYDNDGALILYLYGGRQVTYRRNAQRKNPPAASSSPERNEPREDAQEEGAACCAPTNPDNFTVIPGVGTRTATKLHEAGILTLKQLQETRIQALFGIIPRNTIEAIEMYFKES